MNHKELQPLDIAQIFGKKSIVALELSNATDSQKLPPIQYFFGNIERFSKINFDLSNPPHSIVDSVLLTRIDRRIENVTCESLSIPNGVTVKSSIVQRPSVEKAAS